MTTTITGRLARDPETKQVGTTDEHTRVELIVLENTGRMTRDGWKEDEEPTRHVVHAWRYLGTRAASLRTGDAVVVVGRDHTQAWIDRDTNEKRRRRVIEAEHIGVDLRTMQVQARKPRKPGLDDAAKDGWASLATAEPSVRRELSDEDAAELHSALEDAAATARAAAEHEREDLAYEHKHGQQLRADAEESIAATVAWHEQRAATLSHLAERIITARRITLDERA